jgi:xanthine dehydrogenase accessory factor
MLHAMTGTTEILRQLRDWRNEGHDAALCTVVSTWGSAPRPMGGHMAVRDSGDFVGSVSGGCVEAAVVDEARGSMAASAARVVEYGVSDDEAWAVGLACGGRVRISVVPVGDAGLNDDTLQAVIQSRDTHDAIVLATWMETGAAKILRPLDGDATDDSLVESARAALLADRATLAESATGEVFLRPHNRPVRVIIVGAAHVSQSLVPLVTTAGFEAIVVDPRAAFATEERFPGVRMKRSWPAQALAELGLNHRTAIVTVTHDPKLDDPALLAAVQSEVFYIGALGSRRTHAARCERLGGEGADAAALERIHAPIGLDIGARTTEEIAVSIIAEIVQELRG